MAISSGIYGLAGVIIGSGATWAAQWSVAARSDRLDARIARLQVRAELRRLRGAFEFVRDEPKHQKFILTAYVSNTEQWNKHSDHLARQLSESSWDWVQRAYDKAVELCFLAREGADVSERAALMVELIDEALERLE